MKKFLIPSLVIVAVIGLGFTGFVLADESYNGFKGKDKGYEAMLQKKADIFGLSIEELKAAKESGKTFLEIIEEQGMTREEFHEKMQAQKENYFNELIESGKITQEQADEKLEYIGNRYENHDCSENGFFKRVMMKRGFNF